MRATRDDSGWKIDEPVPTIAAARRISANDCACESSSKPVSVQPMPATSEYGFGWRSVYIPTSGCSNEAVTW